MVPHSEALPLSASLSTFPSVSAFEALRAAPQGPARRLTPVPILSYDGRIRWGLRPGHIQNSMKASFSVRSAAAAVIASILAVSHASGASLVSITDLFNTGVDAGGVPLANGTPDPHYTFASTPAGDPDPPGPVAVNSETGFPIPPWLGDSATSSWIVPRPNTTGAAGDYVYRTTFTIPAGSDPSQAFIRGMHTSDNGGVDILLNGSSTGITSTGNFPAFDPAWRISRGFVSGLNTLDIVINEAAGGIDSGGYTGLRAEMSGFAAPSGHVPIPGIVSTGLAGGSDSNPGNDNDRELNFTLNPASPVSGDLFVTTSAGGFPIGPWVGDSLTSAWISPSMDTNAEPGTYLYDLEFDLTGLDPTTASIVGAWSSDDGGTDILLNGVSLGETNGGFGGFTDFTVAADEGDAFLPGLNTLTFVVDNGGAAPNPTGLRVEFLSATAAVIPEPDAVLFAAIGGVLALLRRRRR